MNSTMNITVLGAGNGALAAAAHMKLMGHRVTLSNRSSSKLLPLMEHPVLTVRGGALPNSEVAIDEVILDIPTAVQNADLILLAVPTMGLRYYAEKLAPHLKESQSVLLNPGHCGGLLQFTHALRENGYTGKFHICETGTLTYVCRMEGPRIVGLYKISDNITAFATSETSMRLARDLYPSLIPADSTLAVAFGDLNSVVHPAGMLLNAAAVQRTKGSFTFYHEGITPAVGTLIGSVDRERLAAAKAYGIILPPYIEVFYKNGLTTEKAYRSGSIYEALHQSAPNKTIMCEPDLQGRFVEEDVGFGLVPLSALARLSGVRTPVMDSMIHLFSEINGKDYFTEGLTLEKMGLAGCKTPAEVISYINTI